MTLRKFFMPYLLDHTSASVGLYGEYIIGLACI